MPRAATAAATAAALVAAGAVAGSVITAPGERDPIAVMVDGRAEDGTAIAVAVAIPPGPVTGDDPVLGQPCAPFGGCGVGVWEEWKAGTYAALRCSSRPGGSADQSAAERCDGTDNDCDGETDEDLDCACRPPNKPERCDGCGAHVGDGCRVGEGACERVGVTRCDAGRLVCSAAPGTPRPERCTPFELNENRVVMVYDLEERTIDPDRDEGVDEDCDGKIDEGCLCVDHLGTPSDEPCPGARR